MQRGFLGGLLGAAAGIAMASGAQAADLPVKAKPVEYVKICSAYGAGFYYIPGTDICLRVGGYVRIDYWVHGGNAAPIFSGGWKTSGLEKTRDNAGSRFFARALLINDARTNTAYGTLRSYTAIGAQYSSDGGGDGSRSAGDTAVYFEKAFIQFAGFTFGFTDSFFNYPQLGLYAANVGAPWKWTSVLAYTAQLGNGVSATLAFEDAGRTSSQIFGTGSANVAGVISGQGSGYTDQYIPDIVGNVRVDQSWGSAQIMAAAHQLRPAIGVAASDAWGWAIGAGITLKTPQTGAGDNIIISGAYTKGAVNYTGMSTSPAPNRAVGGYDNPSGGALVPGMGAELEVFDLYGSQKSTAWSIGVQGTHYWTPSLRSNLAVGYFDFEAPSAALAAGFNSGNVVQVGANTIWTPVSGLDLGIELMWSRVKADYNPATAQSLITSGSYDVVHGMFRAQRNY